MHINDYGCGILAFILSRGGDGERYYVLLEVFHCYLTALVDGIIQQKHSILLLTG